MFTPVSASSKEVVGTAQQGRFYLEHWHDAFD